MNTWNFNFAKQKVFFKNIGRYATTSTYIHVRIPFNFTTMFNTKEAIARVYDKLLNQHEGPFKSITKWITDVSLSIIEGSLEDFCHIIKALPQKSEISMPGQPKRFIANVLSIPAMAMSTFNTIRITQLNDKINSLKEKTDLILDMVHLHKKHLHHLDKKLDNKLFGWFAWIQHLVLLQGDRRQWKKVSIGGSPPQKCCEICPTSLTRSRSPATWGPGWNHQSRHPGGQEKVPGPIREICLGPLPDWGLAPIYRPQMNSC